MPNITIAALGENAPMIGAALLPWEHARANRYSASIMCADIMHLDRDFDQLKEAGINLFHMDIMDGHFVPNLMIPMEYINRMRKTRMLCLMSTSWRSIRKESSIAFS